MEEMSYMEMLRIWRFATNGDPRLQGEEGKKFAEIMFRKEKELEPGEKVAISKALGWNR